MFITANRCGGWKSVCELYFEFLCLTLFGGRKKQAKPHHLNVSFDSSWWFFSSLLRSMRTKTRILKINKTDSMIFINNLGVSLLSALDECDDHSQYHFERLNRKKFFSVSHFSVVIENSSLCVSLSHVQDHISRAMIWCSDFIRTSSKQHLVHAHRKNHHFGM